jgi:hypothetical protein
MRPIPEKLKKEMNSDPFYKKCIRHKEQTCGGRITFEHALIYAGKQINEKFAILPVCEKHHGVNRYQDRGDLDKRYHEWVALNRMSPEDEKKYPRRNWQQEKIKLNKIYEGERCPASFQE